MPVKIRIMQPTDKAAIMAIMKATPAFVPEDVAVAEEVIDSYLNDPVDSGYNFYIAEYESQLAGYICYGATPLTQGTWDIYWIATESGQRNKGIGGTLLKFAEEAIRESGGRMILIETASNPSYTDARNFYLAHNYQQISIIPDFYAHGDDKLTFRKIL